MKKTVTSLLQMKQKGEKISMLTCYDYSTAKLMDAADIDMLLVGDSLGNTMLGYSTTIPVTMEESLHHCRAVVRGTRGNAFVIGDMPFMSYHASEESALLNAAKFLQDAGCDAVKMEGGFEVVSLVKRMTTAGIPVCAHIGLCPQQVKVQGGYRIAGRTEDAAERLMQEALALEEAGAFMIVLECVTASVAEAISRAISIPTIGIGSGAACDGQVQVVTDILGISGYVPKHAKRYADLSAVMEEAFSSYVEEVRSGKFPTDENAHQ